MAFRKLPRSFYLQPTLKIAAQLPGKYLIRRLGKEKLVGRIVEVEAYLGSHDPASHAFRGKTRRNEVMFRTGGHAYVYFTYGMHFCFNIVTEQEGIGHAVLLRAIEPLQGVGVMQRHRRRGHAENSLVDLCNGPAKLCQAYGIARAQNGTDLCGTEIWIAEDTPGHQGMTVARSTRIGISVGLEHKWRFYLSNCPFVSRGKPVSPQHGNTA